MSTLGTLHKDWDLTNSHFHDLNGIIERQSEKFHGDWQRSNTLFNDFNTILNGFLGITKMVSIGAAVVAVTELIISCAVLYQNSRAITALEEITKQLSHSVEQNELMAGLKILENYNTLRRDEQTEGYELDARQLRCKAALGKHLDSSMLLYESGEASKLSLLKKHRTYIDKAAKILHQYSQTLARTPQSLRTILVLPFSMSIHEITKILLKPDNEQNEELIHIVETRDHEINYVSLMSVLRPALTEEMEAASKDLAQIFSEFANLFVSNHYYSQQDFTCIVDHIYYKITDPDRQTIPLKKYRQSISDIIEDIIAIGRELHVNCQDIINNHQVDDISYTNDMLGHYEAVLFRTAFLSSALKFHNLCNTWSNTHYQNWWGMVTFFERIHYKTWGYDMKDSPRLIYWAEESDATDETNEPDTNASLLTTTGQFNQPLETTLTTNTDDMNETDMESNIHHALTTVDDTETEPSTSQNP